MARAESLASKVSDSKASGQAYTDTGSDCTRGTWGRKISPRGVHFDTTFEFDYWKRSVGSSGADAALVHGDTASRDMWATLPR
jgi:hypothetical protein